MFVLRGAAKLLFGSGNNQETLVELPQGQLYLVRPLSPKGYSELLFKDASARIRRTAQDFQYQLVVQRVYEEGEAELLAEEEGEDADIDADILAAERDEKTFLLDEALHFRVEQREGGDHVLAWRDLSGDVGDVYEFVCDTTISSSLVDQFELAAKQCQYERRYRKPNTLATEEDLQQFEFFDEPPIPQASPIHSPALLTRSIDSIDAMPLHSANTSVKREKAAAGPSTPAKSTPIKSTPVKKERNYSPPKATVPPEAREVMAAEKGELHFYDFPSGAFVLQADSVTATVSEIGNWKYWLQVSTPDREWLGIPISSEINPVFNPEYLSFIFNQFTDDGSAYSWLLRFKDQPTLDRFQEGLTSALWEQQNEMKWAKIKETEQNYVLDAFNDLVLEDQHPEEEEEEEEEEFEDAEDGGPQSEHHDTDEEDDDVEYKPKDTDTNKSIAVGYKHDRSFVVRGSKIGVFKHTPSNHLEFSTNISKVETPKGELFSPTKVMLHNEDRNLVLQKDGDPNKLYRMDLEYGKVVDEWKVHDDIPVVTFAPENKFAQMTHEPTFLGISRNALYRIDPRVSGAKLVDSQLKQYASKNDFSALATTEKGYIAVASNKGDIRLFDRLGINAKTHIPALGEPILGLDVSADGRWVLATCRNYLLLVDALQRGGKNDGKLGFEKSFAADSKPQPRRLALTPEHVAQFTHETGKPVNFTPAKFNTGTGTEETSIITATGPYIIEWNLKKVLTGRKTPYLIKRYTDDVKADDFKFGTDKNVIVALPHEVNMVDHTRLKRPTRESIAGDFLDAARRGSGNRVGGPRTPAVQRLRREDIVNSPY